MVVVIGVISVVLPALFAILFTVLQQQLKIYALQEMKRQGDNALVAIETTIKNNAVGIYADEAFATAKCTTTGSYYQTAGRFIIKDRNGKWFEYVDDLGHLASNSAAPRMRLTTDKVTISNFSISCNKGQTSPYISPLITISFDIRHNSNIYTMHYQTKIKLRSY